MVVLVLLLLVELPLILLFLLLSLFFKLTCSIACATPSRISRIVYFYENDVITFQVSEMADSCKHANGLESAVMIIAATSFSRQSTCRNCCYEHKEATV